jgi:synaptosomal-associated protein 29
VKGGGKFYNMAEKQYVTNPNSPFFSVEEEDDVDDETFLRHSKSGSYGYKLPNNSNCQGNSALEDNRLQLLERRKAIEERTLQSSERSISLLRESEQIGVATAEVCCCLCLGYVQLTILHGSF